MRNRIIAICPKVFPGVCQVFRHAQKLGYLDFQYLEMGLDFSKYDIMILGAYHQSYEELLSIQDIKKYVLITSSTSQIEQSNELSFINRILEWQKQDKIDGILIGDKDLYKCFASENVHWFPYPLHDALLPIQGKPKIKGSIGLFAPNHHRKNILTQMMAVRLMNYKHPEIKLYTNTNRILNGNIEYLGWISDNKEYYELLSKMRLILNCFFSESFCYSTIESIIMGTIPIISPCIRDNLDLPNKICVENINSPVSIAKKIQDIMVLSKSAYIELLRLCQVSIENLVSEHNANLKELLDRL